MRKGFRKRLRGWRRKRFVERLRYHKLISRRRRKRIPSVRSYSGVWEKSFVMLPGDEKYVTEVKYQGYQHRVGGRIAVCSKGSFLLNIPEVLDFETNYEETARFVSIFHRLLESGKRISYIGFEGLKHISPACVTVFAAYADMWKRRASNVQTWCDTWSPEVEDAFMQIGVFDMLNIKHENKNNDGARLNRRYMPITSSHVNTKAESHDVGSEAQRIQEAVEVFIKKPLDTVQMYGSVTEAIINVCNHAYKGMKIGRLPFRWWISVSYDANLSELGVIIFDHGHGIPKTMKTSSTFSDIRNLLKRREGGWTEVSRLYVAFERGRRRIGGVKSKESGRGHGCQDIARLVFRKDQNQVGEGSSLSVLSGRARYDLKGGSATNRGVASPLKTKLQGTLIEWKIKL